MNTEKIREEIKEWSEQEDDMKKDRQLFAKGMLKALDIIEKEERDKEDGRQT